MKHFKTRAAGLVCCLAALLLLTGCMGMQTEELYCLPEFSDEYLQLQELLDDEISSGCTYYSPAGGNYRSAVQFSDLDGDGTDEAIAFFQTGDQSLKICIYRPLEDDYELAAAIAGDGTSVGSVEYADMDGNGRTELIVAWQISSDLRMLKAYDLRDWTPTVLLTAECSQFLVADMDGADGMELISLFMGTPDSRSAEMFCIGADGETVSSSARLSAGIFTLDRLRTGYLDDGSTAVFVESSTEDGRIITDILASRGGRLSSVAYDPASGVSSTVRAYAVYCTDIDGDRSMEIPAAVQLYAQPGASSVYWAFDWYSYAPDGTKTLKLSTYHCYSDGWYLELDSSMRENLTVRRADAGSGERAVVISSVSPDTGEVTDLLTIYALTGDNRAELAELGGRFTLAVKEDIIYAARTYAAAMTEDQIKESFRLIHTEWITGAL